MRRLAVVPSFGTCPRFRREETVPDQSLHTIVTQLRRPRLCSMLPRLRRVTVLLLGCVISPIVALSSARLAAQEPGYARTQALGSPSVQAVIQPRPNGFQPDTGRPTVSTARDMNTFSSVGQPWPGGPTERLAQNPTSPEIIRPGVPAVQGTQPFNAPPRARICKPCARHRIAV